MKITRSLDTSGKCCPMPIVELNKTMGRLAPGDVLEVLATDPGTRTDIPSWCERTGNELLRSESRDSGYRYLVRKKCQGKSG
ncbi:MAG TPA: sulfurtransferase TusA family protein [Chromatiales bacterium]|nr:sulfurtransferase TusA family protein [Chromatiales bacterium]